MRCPECGIWWSGSSHRCTFSYATGTNLTLSPAAEVVTVNEWIARAEKAEAERDSFEKANDVLNEVAYRLQGELDEHRAHYVDPREYQRLRDGIEALADTVDGDDGAAHNYGCDDDPTCLACIVADLRLIASGPDQRLTDGTQ